MNWSIDYNISIAILRYNSWRVHRVCALDSSSLPVLLLLIQTGIFAGFHGGGGAPQQNTQLPPPKGRRKKEKRRESEWEKEGGSVYVFNTTIYLIILRLVEYHRLKSITPHCHYILSSKNTKLMVIWDTVRGMWSSHAHFHPKLDGTLPWHWNVAVTSCMSGIPDLHQS